MDVAPSTQFGPAVEAVLDSIDEISSHSERALRLLDAVMNDAFDEGVDDIDSGQPSFPAATSRHFPDQKGKK